MKTKFYFFILTIFISFSSFAQSYTVSGVVSDSDNQSLPGVSVVIKGTAKGTSTDFDGKYSIEVTNGDVLVFTSVGFETQQATISGQSVLNITMKSGLELDEVVVVGSRNPNRTAVDTAVPVDVIDVTELLTAGPQVNLNQILNYVAPSFTSNT